MDVNLFGSLTQVLAIEDASQVGHARRTAQKLAECQGFAEHDAGRVALVATELASNLLKHAGHGVLHLRALPGPGVELLAIDRAQGCDLNACLADGFSTRGTQGIGLGAVLRQAEVFDAYSDARGTALLARFYPQKSDVGDQRVGISHHALEGEDVSGDTWHLARWEADISLLVIDGLGHGAEAAHAAQAGERVFAGAPFSEPTQLLRDMHQAMNGTRGGAVAIAQFQARAGQLRFIGVGNIGARLLAGENSRGLASYPGIVGGQYRSARAFDYAHLDGQLLIMFSDGLQSRWNLADYPGLAHRHPALIAAVLHRDYCRGRDDVTVLVVELEGAHD